MVHSAISRLHSRRVFDQTFDDTSLSRFTDGEVDAAKMLNGLVTIDIALEAQVVRLI